MDRLVYSPSIKVWVKADTGIIDLSPYVVNCRVERNISDISKAEIEFRNPKVNKDGKPRFLFTEQEVGGKILPVFHPMDPITIVLERIAGRPIQVFTGYCDSVPDVQLFPGTAKISASCTLKRLLYTYWDPALPFVVDFMKANGWNLDNSTGIAGTKNTDYQKLSKVNNLNDSSIGNLLYSVLHEIGGWNDKNIYIQPLPNNIGALVLNLFNEIEKDNKKVNEEITKFIRDIVGQGQFGSAAIGQTTNAGAGGDGTLGGPVHNEEQKVKTIRSAANAVGVPPELALAVAIVETQLGSAVDNRQHYGAGQNDWYQWTVEGNPPYQPYCNSPSVDWTKGTDLHYAAEMFCKAAKVRAKNWHGVNWQDRGYPAWARVTQLAPCDPFNSSYGGNNPNPDSNHLYSDSEFPTYINQAKQLLRKYP